MNIFSYQSISNNRVSKIFWILYICIISKSGNLERNYDFFWLKFYIILVGKPNWRAEYPQDKKKKKVENLKQWIKEVPYIISFYKFFVGY